MRTALFPDVSLGSRLNTKKKAVIEKDLNRGEKKKGFEEDEEKT